MDDPRKSAGTHPEAEVEPSKPHQSLTSNKDVPRENTTPAGSNGTYANLDQDAGTIPAEKTQDGDIQGDAEVDPEEPNGQDEMTSQVSVTTRPSGQRKKKRSKKPKSKRGLNAATGMEEFFVDPPLTPEQFEENQAMYAQDIPFIDRILIAIQRFERTRKLSNTRRDIFYKYLAYGGVEVGPNMFQSVSEVQKKEMSKDEFAVALSQVSIGTDKHDVISNNGLYDVDFLGCAKAYFSRRAPQVFALDNRDKVVEITTTVERFMDYLLQHDVCNDYRDDVLATRDFCRHAADEMWACSEASRQLIDAADFNIACSTLLQGSYSRAYDGETYWGEEKPGESNFVGFTPELATQIMGYAMAGAAPENIWKAYQRQITIGSGLSVDQVKEQVGFEITIIIPPTKACLKMYQSAENLRPVGVVLAKPWADPGAPPEDLTPEERAQQAAAATITTNNGLQTTITAASHHHSKEESYIFLIEQSIQRNIRVGTKIEATLHKTSCGMWFFDEVRELYPSFDTYLYNDLMVGYEKPRWLKGSVPYEEEEEEQLEAERLRAQQVEEAEEEAERRAEGDDDDMTSADGHGVVVNGQTHEAEQNGFPAVHEAANRFADDDDEHFEL